MKVKSIYHCQDKSGRKFHRKTKPKNDEKVIKIMPFADYLKNELQPKLKLVNEGRL